MTFALRFLVILGALLALPSASFAHESRPAYLALTEISEDTYQMIWKVPAKGRFTKLALTVEFDDAVSVVMPVQSEFSGGAVVERSTIQRQGGLAGASVLIEGLSSTLTDALVRIEDLQGQVQTIRVSPENPQFEVQAEPGRGEVASVYTSRGVKHIWEGIDHLLFVACLMLVAGRGRKLLATITGFTLAHSVTLALSTLNVIVIPIPPVEAVIALSIVFLAVEIAKGDKESLTYRYPMTVSSSFGLLHGFGFAAVLNEVGLPANEVPVALLFFNVGVELGQIAFVIAILVLFWVGGAIVPALKQERPQRVLQRATVYVVGSVAAFWMFERIYGFWG